MKLTTKELTLFALLGSMGGTWLQHHTPDVVLKYLLLVVLPVVAVITLRTRRCSDVCLQGDYGGLAKHTSAGGVHHCIHCGIP